MSSVNVQSNSTLNEQPGDGNQRRRDDRNREALFVPAHCRRDPVRFPVALIR